MKNSTNVPTMIVPHSRPYIDYKDVEAVVENLCSGKIAQGKYV
jgi:hypothetical protein